MKEPYGRTLGVFFVRLLLDEILYDPSVDVSVLPVFFASVDAGVVIDLDNQEIPVHFFQVNTEEACTDCLAS